MYEKVLAVLALIIFGTFIGILAWWVDSIPLKVVLFGTFSLAVYDFWLDAFSGKNNGNGH